MGDSVYYDVDGALAVGMPAAHVDPFGLCSSSDHLHITGIGDVLAVLADRDRLAS